MRQMLSLHILLMVQTLFYEGLYGLLTFVMKCHKNTVNVLMANYNSCWK